jgi:hypothetical protein
MRFVRVTMLVLATLVFFSATKPSFEQETVQTLQELTQQANACPVSHIMAINNFVPITVKIFHDPTPDFLVYTNATNVGSQITSDGSDPHVYLITTNSTDSFKFVVNAKYRDNVEHQIFIEYWSQNENTAVEQLQTVNGDFCRDILVDTSVQPPQIDIAKTIKNAEATDFQALTNSIVHNNNTLGSIVVGLFAFNVFVIVFMVITYLKSKNTDDQRRSERKSIISMVEKGHEMIETMGTTINQVDTMSHLQSKEISSFTEKTKATFESILNRYEVMMNSVLLEFKNNTGIDIKIPAKPKEETQDKPIEQKEKSKFSFVSIPFLKKDKEPENVVTQEKLYEIYNKEKDTSKLRKRHENFRQVLMKDPDDKMARMHMDVLYKIIQERLPK